MAPVGKLSIGVDESEFEEAGPGVGLSVHGDLSAITDEGRGGVNGEGEKKRGKEQE
jgi:hypothetical protein